MKNRTDKDPAAGSHIEGYMMSQRIIVRQARAFSSTARRASILDYFKPSSSKGPSTKEVIKKVEQDEVQSSTKVRIIGRRNPEKENAWKERMNGFEVKNWIPTETTYQKLIEENPAEPEKVISSLLLKTYNDVNATTLTSATKETELTDLQKRFELVKNLQVHFGVTISDFQMTTFKNLERVDQFLQTAILRAKKFNEKEPNAVYLDKDAFKGTNVTISEFVSDSQKEKRFKKLLREARALERSENQRLIESKLNES